ncbi:hypothetical protein D1AOALGA4SA_12789 [Olavius algarvensis Delta 1 endosymbiont]|nr:hypothetical protein D1AOALGA4SA_12789 [Olavius algarvensis Delta 1 endosymbiont]
MTRCRQVSSDPHRAWHQFANVFDHHAEINIVAAQSGPAYSTIEYIQGTSLNSITDETVQLGEISRVKIRAQRTRL